jgi:hypothetical protein
MYVHTHISTYDISTVCVHIYRLCVYIYIYISVYMYMYLYVCMYVCMYVCTYIYNACIYVCMYTYIHMWTCVFVWMRVCSYRYMWAHSHGDEAMQCVCIYVCMYACMYACMCECVYVHIYIYIYIYIHIYKSVYTRKAYYKHELMCVWNHGCIKYLNWRGSEWQDWVLVALQPSIKGDEYVHGVCIDVVGSLFGRKCANWAYGNCVYVCMHACILCIYTKTWMYACICICIYMYVCIHIGICKCIYMYICT